MHNILLKKVQDRETKVFLLSATDRRNIFSAIQGVPQATSDAYLWTCHFAAPRYLGIYQTFFETGAVAVVE